MIYQSLNDIPLYVFNKMLLGDTKAVLISDDGENEQTISDSCAMLISEYHLILGNSAMKEVCIMYEDTLNLERKLILARAGCAMKNINSQEATDYAIEIGQYLGYKDGDLFEFLQSREKYYSQRYEIGRLAIEKYQESIKGEKQITEKDLANERAALMMSGINIDQHKISAMEYACLLKSKIEEVKAQKKLMKKNG